MWTWIRLLGLHPQFRLRDGKRWGTVSVRVGSESLKSVPHRTLRSKRPTFDRTFFWRTYRQAGMRSGKWKYIRDEKNEFLYDLSVDEREQADFKAAQPSILERLRGECRKWEATVHAYPNE